MSIGIATRGYIHPLIGTIGGGGGGGGASGIAIPFEMKDADGNLVDDAPSGSEIKVSVNGAAFATGVGTVSHVTGGGLGAYYYTLDTTEVGTNWVWLRISKTSHQLVSIIWDIDDKATRSQLDDQTTTLGNSIAAARDAMLASVGGLPTAAEIDTQLTSSHGSGAWSGSDTAAIDAALTASHGSGSWQGATAVANAAAVWAALGEGAHTYGDLVRGILSALIGPSDGYDTGTVHTKSLDGTKTRWSVVTDDTGRITLTPGDLT